MSIGNLSLSGFLNEMRNASTGPHSRKFCFVIGAGASVSSGIKTGKELVDEWDRELCNRNSVEYEKWKMNNRITDKNKYSFYSKYYEYLYERNPENGYNYLEKLMDKAKPSAGYVTLAGILAEKQHNVVVTTNFDHLTEDAINYYAQEMPLVIGHESLTHYITKRIQRPTIVKIHRDLFFKPANTTRAVEKLHKNWETALNKIFSEYSPIFIGYAGNDKSLMNYLVRNAEKFAKGEFCCPYWMLYKDDVLEGRVKRFLNKSNGYCIKHEGFDYVLFCIGEALGYNRPSEEIFVGDAKKRFIALSEETNKLTEKFIEDRASGVISSLDSPSIERAVQKAIEGNEQEKMYWNILVLCQSEKYEEALIEIQRLMDLAPDNARYHSLHSSILSKLGNSAEAQVSAKKAVELEPDNAAYQVKFAGALNKLERYEEALVAAQIAVELEPDDAFCQANLGAALYMLKRYEEALVAMQIAVALEPNNASYQNSFGITFNKLERYEEALVAAQIAVALEPDSAAYQLRLAGTLDKLERNEGALTAVQRAVELEPNNASYQNSLGITLNKLERYEEALTAVQKAVELKPDNAVYQVRLAGTLNKLGRNEEALVAAQIAVELEPDDAFCQANLGATLYMLKRYEEALVAMQIAVELEPDDALYQANLGIMLNELKRYEEALAAMQIAVALKPEYASYQFDLRSKLHELERNEEAKE